MSTIIVPGTKLTALTETTTLLADNLFYTVDGASDSYKTTMATLCSAVDGFLRPYNDSRFLALTGGTITGAVTGASNAALVFPEDTSTYIYLSSVQVADTQAASKGYVKQQLLAANTVTKSYVDSTFVGLAGNQVLSANIGCADLPAQDSDYTNKLYINTNTINISGGTMTGNLILPAQTYPVSNQNSAATVGYVESRIATQPGSRLNSLSAFIVNGDNSGRGNSGNQITYIIDNDNKVRASGLFGRRYSGGFGYYESVYDNFPTVPVEFQTNDGTEFVKAIASTGQSSFILTNSGRIYSAGDNTAGQLGLGDTNKRYTFNYISSGLDGSATTSMPSICAIESSLGLDVTTTNNSMFAIDGTGELWSWGSNKAGQLGLGNTTNKSAPNLASSVGNSTIQGKSIKQVAASNSDTKGYTLVLDWENKVHVTGNNVNGQLSYNANNKTDLNAFGFSQMWTVSTYFVKQKVVTAPVLVDASVTADKVYVAGSVSFMLTGGQIYACGHNGGGAIGNGTPGVGNVGSGKFQTFWSKVLSGANAPVNGVKDITTNGDLNGNVSVCATLSSGSIVVWGYNNSGQLGTGDYNNKGYAVTPSTAPGGIVKAKMVGVGTNTSLMLLTTSGDIYATGYVNFGLDGRGEGNITKQNTFQRVLRPQGVRWINFDVYSYGSKSDLKTVLAQASGSDLYAWGYNNYSQAGIQNIGAGGINPNVIDVPLRVSLF